MTSFVSGSSTDIKHLGIQSNSACWMGKTVDAAIRDEVRRAGLTWGETADTIRTSPGALVTAEALRAFKAASEGITGPVRGVISGPMAQWAENPCFGPPARLYRNVPLGREDEPHAEVSFESPCREVSLPSADAPGGRTLEFSLSDGFLISTHHWSGLLWGNLLGLAPTLWRHLVGPNFNLIWKLPWAWLRRRTRDPMVLAGAFNRRERGVRIHPSAVVEGCWLQEGAIVGPGAVVRGCVLGPGSVIEPQALAVFSVLGRGAVVQRRGWIQFGVVHSRAAVGGAMQLGVLGPEVAFKHGSYLMDQNVDQSVSAMVDGERVPAPLGLLGVGVGARSVIGSGVWIGPGRSVGPDQTILASPGGVLVRPDATLVGTFAVENGCLKRI